MADNLDRFVPGALPDRPEILTYDDGQIYEATRKHQRGLKLGKEAQSQLDYFGRWRKAIEQRETERVGNLLLLFRCTYLLEAADEYQRATLVREFVWRKYGARIPDTVPTNWEAALRWAKRNAEDRQHFPVHLRCDTKPPHGQFTRPAETEQPNDNDHTDPDEPPF